MTKLISKDKDQRDEWDEIWTDKHLMNRIVNFGRTVYNVRWFLLLKPYVGVDSFAELGCGTASLLASIAKHAKKVTGIDYSDQALDVSRKKFKALGIKNARFVNDNALGLKTKEKFDTVWSQGLIEHFSDPGKVIREHVRATKTGGTTVISAPFKYSYHLIWYTITRPRLLRRFWPWTEQIFISKNDLLKAMKKYCPDQTDFKIKIAWVFGLIFLIVHKK